MKHLQLYEEFNFFKKRRKIDRSDIDPYDEENWDDKKIRKKEKKKDPWEEMMDRILTDRLR